MKGSRYTTSHYNEEHEVLEEERKAIGGRRDMVENDQEHDANEMV